MRNGGYIAPTDWTEQELDILRTAYSNQDGPVGVAKLEAMLGRSRGNISRKAGQLGLTNKYRKRVLIRADRNKFDTQEQVRKFRSDRMKGWLLSNGHPRGYQGKKHSEETRKILGAKSKAAWDDPNSKTNSEESRQRRSDQMLQRVMAGITRTGYSRSRGGKRDDLGGIYFRSAWEANYARYLNFLVDRGEIKGWAYEPKTFIFESIKRGTRAYTPDFRVDSVDGSYVWHEVKGWMDDKSKTRLARFGKYFPSEKLVVVDSAWFKSANKTIGKMIHNWESGTVR